MWSKKIFFFQRTSCAFDSHIDLQTTATCVSQKRTRWADPPIALLLALHRYWGGRGRTAQAPRGEGHAPPSAIASRRTLPPDSLSYFLVRVFPHESSASDWGQLKNKLFFLKIPRARGGPASAGSIIIVSFMLFIGYSCLCNFFEEFLIYDSWF